MLKKIPYVRVFVALLFVAAGSINWVFPDAPLIVDLIPVGMMFIIAALLWRHASALEKQLENEKNRATGE